MATSPNLKAEGVLRATVTSDGQPIPDTAQLISITVRSAINQVPGATLVFADGFDSGFGESDTAEQAFALSDSAHFKPGALIEVKAGYGDTETKIFSGIVVRHGLSISGSKGARLSVECRDKASGCVVVASDGTVDVAAPQVSGPAVLSVAYRIDLIEFEADLDSAPAPDPGAKAQQLRSGLPRLRGHMRFHGSALAEVGTLVDVKGLGQRFSGAVFVTGVTHQIEDGGWSTTIDFGLPVA
jgi:phage protein D